MFFFRFYLKVFSVILGIRVLVFLFFVLEKLRYGVRKGLNYFGFNLGFVGEGVGRSVFGRGFGVGS